MVIDPLRSANLVQAIRPVENTSQVSPQNTASPPKDTANIAANTQLVQFKTVGAQLHDASIAFGEKSAQRAALEQAYNVVSAMEQIPVPTRDAPARLSRTFQASIDTLNRFAETGAQLIDLSGAAGELLETSAPAEALKLAPAALEDMAGQLKGADEELATARQELGRAQVAFENIESTSVPAELPQAVELPDPADRPATTNTPELPGAEDVAGIINNVSINRSNAVDLLK